MDRKKHTAHQPAGEYFGRSFEGLRVRTEPYLDDSLAADSLVDASGDRFHLGEFGHGLIIASRRVGV